MTRTKVKSAEIVVGDIVGLPTDGRGLEWVLVESIEESGRVRVLHYGEGRIFITLRDESYAVRR